MASVYSQSGKCQKEFAGLLVRRDLRGVLGEPEQSELADLLAHLAEAVPAEDPIGEFEQPELAALAVIDAMADWHLQKVNEQLVGVVPPDGLDPDNILVLSASQRKQQQELLLLVKPFAWLAGPTGSAIFEVTDRGIGRWNVRRR